MTRAMNALVTFARSPQTSAGLPPFALVTPEQVVPALDALLADLDAGRTALELRAVAGELSSWSGAVDALVDLIEPMERAWGLVSHLNGVKNSPALREAHQEAQPRVVGAFLALAQSEPLYQALLALRDSPEGQVLSAARKRILDKKILEAKLSGIGLPDVERARFTKIEQDLSELSTTFSNQVLDATKAFSITLTSKEQVMGLPPSALAMASAQARAGGDSASTPEAGPWKITLDFPSFDPVLRYATDRSLRERLYRAFIARASELDDASRDNRALIDRILALRAEKAKLLGFATFAELSLATKMAPSVDELERLLLSLQKTARPIAERELAELDALARSDGLDKVAHWDIGFYAEKLRELKYAFNEEELRPYFPLPVVLQGLFSLVQRIFGVSVIEVTSEVNTWHEDVRYFKVRDQAAQQEIAGFFLDPYARAAEKRGGAWMDDCVARRKLASGVRLPVAYLVCNGSPPVDGKPSLMTFREVETLFHEFGHGLQHMLSRVDDVDASGIRGVEWDAVELPSQFMENWCTHAATAIGMSKHIDTGEPLPRALFDKVKAAKTFRAASGMLRQIHLSRVDLELHHRARKDGEGVFEVNRRIARETSVLQPLAEDRFLCGFTHVFAGGYAAGYYSYKWAEVLSADAFGAFEDAGLQDEQQLAAVGHRFKETVLALGGSVHPLEVFAQFRGRGPSTDALLRHAGLAPS